MTKKPKADWEIAREQWLTELGDKASKDQVQLFKELMRSGEFNEFEAIKMAFGWRCPTAQRIWSVANTTGEKLGTHQAVEYLVRVVLGVPTDGSAKGKAFQKDTKKEVQDLLITGIEQGHVISNSDGIRDAARVAVNDTFKKLGFKLSK